MLPDARNVIFWTAVVAGAYIAYRILRTLVSIVKYALNRRKGRTMYRITCSSCGKEGEVPFKPEGDRPVYCRKCYLKKFGTRSKIPHPVFRVDI